MAKLSEQDKAANKASQKIRDKAYHARLSAHRDARAEVEKRIEAGPEAQAVLAARAAMEAGIAARNDAQQAIANQITALQERMIAVGKECEAPINAAKKDRDVAWAAKDKRSRAELARVDAQFPDVANVQYVGAWEIPADVQKRMTEAAEAARKAATA